MTHRKQSRSSEKLSLDHLQTEAVDFAYRVKTAALFCEQRTGKTYITTGLIRRLVDRSFDALGIVPLANIETTWIRVLGSFLPDITICRSLDEYLEAVSPRILLLHYEAVPKVVERLRKLNWSLIWYDESHRLKARGTLQSRTAAKLRDCAERKLILTGTPMDERPNDLWAQFKFLNPSVFGIKWKDYENTFLEPIKFKFGKARPGTILFKRLMLELQIKKKKQKFLKHMMPEFLARIKPYTFRVTKKQAGIAPPVMNWVEVTMRGKQRRLYDDLETDLFSMIGESRITTAMKITQIVKLQQVCGGYLIDDDGEVHEVGRAKLRQVIRIVKNRVRPIVIFCRYREEVHAIAEELELRLNIRVHTFTGETKKKDRPGILNNFQAGKIDVLVAQERTGGVGIDLFHADEAIFYSLTYSFIDFDQALSRIQVRGISRIKKIHLVYAATSIDELIYQAILSKRKVTDVVLSRLESTCRRKKRITRKKHRAVRDST